MKKQHSFLWIVAIFFVCLGLLWPLFVKGFFVSDDGEWMVIRLSAFYQSLSEGQFPVRFLSRLNHSFGYPVANFLYPGFLYIGSVLYALGFSDVGAIKIIIAVSVAVTALVLFFGLRKRFDSESSFVGTVGFVAFPYLSYDIFRRGSVGEILAMVPASLLFYSLLAGSWHLVPIFVALLIVSHNTVALLFLVAYLFLVWTQGKLARAIYPVLLGIGMASFFWIPALLETRFVKFSSITIADPQPYFIRGDSMFLLGIPTVIAIISVVFYRKKIQKLDWAIVVILGTSYAFALPISTFLWQLPLLVSVVQFPFRFMFLPAVLGPWMLAFVWYHALPSRKYIYGALFGFFWVYVLVSTQRQITYVSRPLGYYSTNEGTTTVHDEYMPTWVSKYPMSRAVNNVELVSGDAQIFNRASHAQSIDVFVDANVESRVQINKIFYPGWGVTIDGVRVPVSYENAYGVMQVAVPKGEHRIVAQFRETVSRFIADMISIVCGIVYLVWIKLYKRHS